MLHLTTDRLAALGDELPTPAESAHLASCETCSHEQAAYRSLVAMARAEQSSLGLPLTRWGSIADALEIERSPRVAHSASGRRSTRWPMQAAAGLLFLAGGAVIGRTSAGATPLPGTSVATMAAGQSGVPATLTSSSGQPAADSSFASVDEAREAQQRYELLYQQAAAFLAQHDTTGMGQGSPVAYRSRLAALDRVISTTRDAMSDAPHDPVINGYYLTTLGPREATLRQLNTVLPTSLRLNSF